MTFATRRKRRNERRVTEVRQLVRLTEHKIKQTTNTYSVVKVRSKIIIPASKQGIQPCLNAIAIAFNGKLSTGAGFKNEFICGYTATGRKLSFVKVD